MGQATTEQAHELPTQQQQQPTSYNQDSVNISAPPPAYSSPPVPAKDGQPNVAYESFNERMDPTTTPHHPPQPDQQPAPLVRALHTLGDQPAQVDCPYCRRAVMTRVDKKDSGSTIAAGIALGCLCICLACLPCMLHWCADTDHYCTQCGRQLTHQPEGGQVVVVANTLDNTAASRYANQAQGGSVGVPAGVQQKAN